ncbi:SOS response-associated peptidase [Pseudomonas sp. GV071]|uniref:SOS response-associated peptidase n=1 Tax=Pseudomonas sp. GV071 TaxID=2135754 RepID=UPI000D33A21A|nr:SOS response-associated peptidase [Pseudomonas sp. GV071]PTQ70337.1 putative SOS response-associated peptidase YedK [Pseudomonas sp. GV071]
MCGRYAKEQDLDRWRDVLAIMQPIEDRTDPAAGPRYNIAPTQKAPIIYDTGNGLAAEAIRWGWAPHWAKERKMPPAINARVETVATGNFFRAIWKHRALALADGWFEWVKHPDDPKIKQPYFIKAKAGAPLFFASLCQVTQGLEQAEDDGFTIITAAADSGLLDIHDRRPVVLPPELAAEWIDPSTEPARALAIATDHGLGADAFTWYPVPKAVGSPRNQGPELIQRINDPVVSVPSQPQ